MIPLFFCVTSSLLAEEPLPVSPSLPAAGGLEATDPIETLRVEGSRSRHAQVEGAVSSFRVDELQITRAIPEVLTDALRGVGSIHMQTTTAGQGSPFLRGLTGSGLLSVVDGMRLNNAIYRSAPNPYLDLVDSHLVEEIHVIRGPASVRHGSDAMGGVVSVRSRRPYFEGDDWEMRGLLSGMFASANLARGVRTEFEVGRQDFGLRGGFTGLATSDLRGGGDTGKQIPTAFESVGADAAFTWALDDGQSLNGDFQFMKQPDTPRYDELVAGFGQTEPSSLIFQYQPLERLFAHLNYETVEPFPGVSTLDLDVSFQRIRDDRTTRAYPSPENDYEFREQNASELFGVVLAGRSQVTDQIDLNWGADAYLDWVSSTRTREEVATGSTEPWISRFPNGSKMNSYGVYADVVMQVLPTLEVNGGLRYSYFDTYIAPSVERSQNQVNQDVTGALGFVWSPTDELSLIASFRRGFRAPNVFDLGTIGPRPGNRYNVPTTNLSPEVIYTYDFGFTYSASRIDAEVFGFYSNYNDKIASVLTGLTLPDGRAVVQSSNEKLARLAGVEGSLRVLLSSEVFLVAEAFYTWGEQQVRGGEVEPADRIPPFQGRVGVAYQPLEWIWIEPYVRFAASQNRLSNRDIQDPRINPEGTPGWATLGVRTQWALRENLDLVVEVRNITDADYREHGSGYQAPGAGVATSVAFRF